MAARLAKAFGSTPETWLAMQTRSWNPRGLYMPRDGLADTPLQPTNPTPIVS